MAYDPYPYAPLSALYHFFWSEIFIYYENKVFDNMSADIIATYSSDLYDDKIFFYGKVVFNIMKIVYVWQKNFF